MLDKAILEMLVCPVCQANVEQVEDKIVCSSCLKEYAFEEGILSMMPGEKSQD